MNLLIYIWIIFATIICQIIILFVGYTFLNILPNNKKILPLQKIAISYGLGVGIITFSMFIFIVIGFHSRISYIPILIITSIVFIYFKLHKHLIHDLKAIFGNLKKRKIRYDYLEIFCLALLIFEIIVLISISFIRPIYKWDEMVIWNSKAKYIFYDGNFSYLNYIENVYHLAYPLLVSLNIVFHYSFYGQPYYFVQISFVFFYIFLILFLYYSLRHIKLNIKYSLLICTMIATIIDMVAVSYLTMADVILTYYYTLSTIFLTKFVLTRKSYFLIYSSIFAGFMALTKNEGIGLLIMNFFIFLIYSLLFLFKKETKIRGSLRQIGQFALPALIIYLPWQIFCIYNQLEGEYLTNLTELLNIQNTITDSLIILIGILIITVYCPFWLIFIIVIGFNFKLIIKKKLLFLLVICVFHLLIKVVVYIVSPYGLVHQLFHSINREFIHLAPFAGFALGLVFSQICYENVPNFDKNYELVNKKLILFIGFFIAIYVILSFILYRLFLSSFI